jgi:capsular exopolysaccharide synthesis family protein
MKHSKKSNEQDLKIEPIINFKSIIGRFLGYLPYFILSLLIGGIVTFLINRYSNEKYIVRAQFLIKDKSNFGRMEGMESFLSGMQLVNTSKNIENEIGLMRSRIIVQETLKNCDFNISYFSSGSIKNKELYRNNPFVVLVDSNHLQTYDLEFTIKFKNGNDFDFEIDKTKEDTKYFQQIPKTGQYISTPIHTVNNKYKNNEIIESPAYRFKLVIVNPEAIKEMSEFKFVFNSESNLIRKYSNSYSIKPLNKHASIVDIVKESSEPQKDVRFINALMQTYIQKGLSDKNEISVNTINFIDSYLISVSDSLGVFEDRLQNFRLNNKLIDLNAQGQNLLRNLFELENKKSEEEIRQKYYTYLTDYIRKEKDLNKVIAPSVMGIPDPLLNQLISKLSQVYSEKLILEQNSQKSNPLLIDKEKAIESLKSSIVENLGSIKGNSNIIVNEFNKRIDGFERIALTLPEKEQKLLTIERKYKLNDKLLTYLLEKRAEAGIAGAANISDNKIVDYAVVESKISPNIGRNYMIGFNISLILPFIIVFLIEFFDNRISNHTILQNETNIPLVGNIPNNSNKSSLVIAEHPKSVVSESFRNLRSNINYMGINKNKNNTILITSTVSGEGKTFVSINMASVLAIGGFKTLLIGLDLRKPKIFQDFKLDNNIGITNYLIGNVSKEGIIQKTSIENLSIITSGPIPPNPSELIMSDNFKALLEELKNEFDYIVLDTPPIGLVAEGLDLIQYADIILYMIRQNVTRKNYLNIINELYEKEQNKKIGLVFNDINFASIYGYGYGTYGFGYGESVGYGYNASYGYGIYGENEKEKKSIWKRILGV